MIVEGLRSYGVDVRRFDIHTVGRSDLGEFRPDAVIVDMEDPERPGYVDVDDLVERHAGEGRLVVVSISGRSDADVVRDKLALWDSQYSNRVRVMGFPETVQSVSVSDEVAHLILPMPKTGHPTDQTASFDQRSGIFLGDAATIERLVGDSPHDWISTLRHAVPEAKLYAAQQGEPVRDQVLDVDELWPYSGPELLHRLEAVRLIVSPVRYATYEMVPVEATSIGIPVVYREMPESLSDVLGLSGVRVQTPQELSAVVPLLYRDPALWLSCSRSGNLKAQSQDMRSVAGHLYMGIYRSLAA